MASSIGYAGGAPSYDDDLDLTPLIERLEASPTWCQEWREERGHLSSTDAARESLEAQIRRSRGFDAAKRCLDLVESYERDDAAIARLQGVALGRAA